MSKIRLHSAVIIFNVVKQPMNRTLFRKDGKSKWTDDSMGDFVLPHDGSMADMRFVAFPVLLQAGQLGKWA